MHTPTRFGLSTHLFHESRLERDHLARIADAGFPLVEVFATRTHVDYHDRPAVAGIRQWLDALDLTAWSVHLPITDGIRQGVWGQPLSNASTNAATWKASMAEMTAAIVAAGDLGARVAVLHLGVPVGHKVPPDDNDRAAAGRSLAPLVEACEAASVTLALEVIPNPLATAASILEWLNGDLTPGRPGACLDVGHAHLTGGVVEAIDLLGGHIISTHIHDNAGTGDDHLLPFDGTIDWPSILLALTKAGYDGPLMLELPDHGDAARTLAGAVQARERIRAILDDIAAPFPFEES